MPDEFMNPEVPPGTATADAAVVSGDKPRSRTGLYIALAALAVLAVIAVIAVLLVLFVFNSVQDGIEVTVTPTDQSSPGSTAETDTATASGPADPVTNDEVFTFRDIFKPLAGKTAAAPTGGTDGGATETVDTSEYAADTLYLLAIQSDGGVPKAQMVWNQKELLLSEGDVISGTPWKVLDIRTDDVVMLYGDQQVVLSVGQGISK